MKLPLESVIMKLHHLEEHNKPYVLTIYFNANNELAGLDLYNLVRPLIESNNLSFSEVTICYYFNYYHRIEDYYECIFDIYKEQFIGHRIVKRTISEMSDSLYEIHKETLREINDKKVVMTTNRKEGIYETTSL